MASVVPSQMDEATGQKQLRGQTVKDYVKQVVKEGRGPRIKEHLALIEPAVNIHSFVKHPERNAFINVPLIESNRVQLQPWNEKLDVNYIHANSMLAGGCTYLMTQMPLQRTAYDFWRMVWQQNVRVIMDLVPNGLKSADEDKLCLQYWPTKINNKQSFCNKGPKIHVRTIDIIDDRFMPVDKKDRQKLVKAAKKAKQPPPEFKDDPAYLLYTLEVSSEAGAPNPERCVYLIHYTKWPLNMPGTQLESRPLLSAMITMWHLQQPEPQDKETTRSKIADLKLTADEPIVVHCDAGVKRTGTFVAMDICCRAQERYGQFDVVKTGCRLRKKRYGTMAQVDQYGFIYRAVLDFSIMRRQDGMTNDNRDYDSFVRALRKAEPIHGGKDAKSKWE